ncbi:MAG TPA: rhomboid family intramembrane serine protease [Solirubrobacteraceae bacterium]|nr:rhomboid family intramembrane serine protease [Solirubrobacteraceae bacterium]
MSTGGPDLFVICKSCGSEVSPYITECPYCGNRLRKRAPKLDRDQRVAERKARRQPPPLLTRLRRDEIPGIRGETRPYATVALVLAGLVGCLLWRTDLGGASGNLILIGQPGSEWWRLFTAAFTYENVGYAMITLGTVGLFGWLLERRHGPFPVLVLFLIGGVGGLAATTAIDPNAILLGAQGGALALVCAWATPDLLTLRSGGDIDGDLIGAGVIAVAVALMPLAVGYASWVSDAVGVIAGFAIGVPLALIGER